MKRSESFINKYSLLIIMVLGIVGIALLSLLFDFYYDLNDDVLIKDILSGIYTGTPNAHNNQLMYPISVIYCVFYSLFPSIPWFGLSEILLLLLCFVIITYRLTTLVSSAYMKLVIMICVTTLWCGCYIWELTCIQYTVVSGILAATACVCFYTTPTNQRLGMYLKDNIITMVLCLISYNLRSEMFLLMTPLLAMVGIYKWSLEEHIFTKDLVTKYIGIVVLIAVGVMTTLVIDTVAYSSVEWRTFREFFDARTRVYDITGIPEYEDNRTFYDDNGISKRQIEVLKSYNFANDDSIDSELLNSIADYVDSGKAVSNRTPKSIVSVVREYISNATNWEVVNLDTSTPFIDDAVQHYPMNLIVMALYACLLLHILDSDKKIKRVAVLIMMICFRSIPWVYVYTTQRVLSRITHPMYMLEIMVLIAIIISSWKGYSKRISMVVMALAIAISIINIPTSIEALMSRQLVREERNTIAHRFYDEASDNQDVYYYLDVYSSVSFTEKIFEKVPAKVNWQLAGGWIAKSPLDESKQSRESYIGYRFVRLTEDNIWIME